MIKFIYPLAADIGYRKTAWKCFNEFCANARVDPQRTKLREETVALDSIFVDVDTNKPFETRQRLYTMGFYLDKVAATRLMSALSSTAHRHYRQLTPQMVLILTDDPLKLDNRH